MLTEEVIAELKSKHGEVHQLTHDGESIVVRRPNRQQWKRFRASMQDPVKSLDAIENLLRDSLVFPDLAGLDAILDRRPGLAETFGSNVVKLAGGGSPLEVEKKAL